jgi:hypothetical protein
MGQSSPLTRESNARLRAAQSWHRKMLALCVAFFCSNQITIGKRPRLFMSAEKSLQFFTLRFRPKTGFYVVQQNADGCGPVQGVTSGLAQWSKSPVPPSAALIEKCWPCT